MNELEAWFAGEDLLPETGHGETEGDWCADFDPDRQLVLLKLGPIRRVFLRPENFVKRFYHEIFALPVDSWLHDYQVSAFDDFCTLHVVLQIRFQATLAYVEHYLSDFDAINQHIRQQYQDMLNDVIDRELRALNNGNWISDGLAKHERRIAQRVCEILTLKHIQAQATCNIDVRFAEFPELALGKDVIYARVLKKMFELNEEKRLEVERQSRVEREEAIAHRKQMAELERALQAQDAQAQIALLQDRQEQLLKQYLVEEGLHADRVAHEQALEQRRFEMEQQTLSERQALQRQQELQRLKDDLAHRALLDEITTRAEIDRRMRAESLWRDAESSSTNQPMSDGDESIN